MPVTPEIRLGLLPPQEAIDYLRQKGLRIGFDHRDVWQQEHQAAFTVAKAMQVDLLQDILGQVDAALANGTTLQTFIQELKPNLVKRGWWGRAMMTDPLTGETKEVQLGSPRRLKVIYDTNLRTAHAEGQWQRIQAAKASLPFLMYDHTPSAHERKEHAAWDGLVLPVDDPWWQSHYPVKAWGCKCRVIQLGQRQMDRKGLKPGQAPAEQLVPYTNNRTGEVQQIPAGVDPAFHYPPGGRLASLDKSLAEKHAGLPADLQQAVTRNADPLQGAVTKVLNKIRNDDVESLAILDRSGVALLRKQGALDHVTLAADELPLLRGNVLVHNHPGKLPLSFSVDDVKLAVWHGISEIHVADLKFNYKMAFPAGSKFGENYWATTVAPLVVQVEKDVTARLDAALAAGTINERERAALLDHMIWTELSEQLPFIYERTPK